MESEQLHPSEVLDRILERRWSFLVTFFLVFLLTYLVLIAIDFVPEPKAATIDREVQTVTTVETELPIETGDEELLTESTQLPTSIYIAKLDKTVPVLNPTSRKIEDLDAALLSGTVRHPDSAALGQDGNVFILGHSSYLPNVYNKNFQAFNGIEDLEWGDLIEVTGQDQVHVFRVDRVYRAKADDATVVPIAGIERRLILATCNSFGTVTDRFIVEATEVSVRAL